MLLYRVIHVQMPFGGGGDKHKIGSEIKIAETTNLYNRTKNGGMC